MKYLTFGFVVLALFHTATAQTPLFRIDQLGPYARAVPGEIIQARIEGLAESPTTMISPKDLEVELTQGATQLKVPARTATNMFVSKSPQQGRPSTAQPDISQMKPLWGIGFLVPKGLQTGDVDVVVIYQSQRTDAVKLTILDRPPRPAIGSTSVERISMAPLSPPSSSSDMGLRLERGAKTELHVSPLVDPDDPEAAILVSFKQGEQSYDAQARVRHEEARVAQVKSSVHFLRDRDLLEVEVPAALNAGTAKMAVSIRANGQTSDAAVMPVLITDATRLAELPNENAPRALVVNPKRVGAGQALTISVDHVRTLNPDPKQTLVMFEQGGVRYTVKPEVNSATFNPAKNDDSPLLLIARPTRQIIGNAQVRVFNPLRGEQGGLSTPTPVEIVDDVTAPELISVSESTTAELSPLRQMYEMQRAAGRDFPEYNPSNRYLSIRVRGLDMNPRHFRISLEQDGQKTKLGFGDLSSVSGELFIVRLPKSLHKGTVVLLAQNEGAEKLSEAATTSFDLK